MGPHRRQVWPRAHAHAYHCLVFGIHILERLRHHRLAACDSAPARRHRHRRRMGHGRHIRRRRVAGASPPHGRRLHAHRLLRRVFSRGAGELRHRQPLRLACDVHCWRSARALAGMGSPRRGRARRLEKKRKRCPLVGCLASVRNAVHCRLAPPHHYQCAVDAGFHLWTVGRDRLCSRGDYRARRGGRPRRSASRATGLMGHHAGFVRDNPWLPGDAVARGTAGPPRCARSFLHPDDAVHRAYLRQGLLPGSKRSAVVFRLPVFSGLGRRQLCRLHFMAA